jgi:hypothetical protein
LIYELFGGNIYNATFKLCEKYDLYGAVEKKNKIRPTTFTVDLGILNGTEVIAITYKIRYFDFSKLSILAPRAKVKW